MNRTRWLLLATAVPLLIVVGLLASAAFDGGDKSASRPAGAAATSSATAARPAAEAPARLFAPSESLRTDVGSGARGAAIFRPRAATSPGPVVIFLHGWLADDPLFYHGWIEHLVHRGVTVIYPIYQEPPFTDVRSPLPNAIAALRLALAQVRLAPGRLVVAGHSAGGALAADYAASARSAGLPAPAAVFSVYPGRSLRGIPLVIPTVSARRIAAGTRVLALAGADDRLVGSRVARTIVRTATRARATLRIVRDPRVDDHGAPARSEPAARRAFWAPLDRLVAATR